MNPDVLIRDEGTVWICTATFKNGTMIMGKVLLTGGRAIFTKVFKSAGAKSITASYSGNPNFIRVQPN